MTREELLQAIADSLREQRLAIGSYADAAALSAVASIEALGFVILPRVPDSDMYLRAGMHLGEAVTGNPGMRMGDMFKAQWDGAVAASPLYRVGMGEDGKQ